MPDAEFSQFEFLLSHDIQFGVLEGKEECEHAQTPTTDARSSCPLTPGRQMPFDFGAVKIEPLSSAMSHHRVLSTDYILPRTLSLTVNVALSPCGLSPLSSLMTGIYSPDSIAFRTRRRNSCGMQLVTPKVLSIDSPSHHARSHARSSSEVDQMNLISPHNSLLPSVRELAPLKIVTGQHAAESFGVDRMPPVLQLPAPHRRQSSFHRQIPHLTALDLASGSISPQVIKTEEPLESELSQLEISQSELSPMPSPMPCGPTMYLFGAGKGPANHAVLASPRPVYRGVVDRKQSRKRKMSPAVKRERSFCSNDSYSPKKTKRFHTKQPYLRVAIQKAIASVDGPFQSSDIDPNIVGSNIRQTRKVISYMCREGMLGLAGCGCGLQVCPKTGRNGHPRVYLKTDNFQIEKLYWKNNAAEISD
eukprot:711969_1